MRHRIALSGRRDQEAVVGQAFLPVPCYVTKWTGRNACPTWGGQMGQSQTAAPKILSSKEVFHGKVFSVTADSLTEGEKTFQREVVRHPGSAAILPAFPDGTVALVRQYRHPAVKYLLEVCAGTLDDRERPEEAAARELEEEMGLVAGNLEKLSEFFVSPGYCEEKMWLYLATDLTETAQRLEEDEALEIERLPLSRALEMITDGEIEDAKTIIGLMLAAPRIGPSMLEPAYPAV